MNNPPPLRRTTTSGRIVYNRKIHFFSYADLARITDKLPNPSSLRDIIRMVKVVLILARKLSDAIRANLYAINLIDVRPLLKEILVSLLRALAEKMDPIDPKRQIVLDSIILIESL